MGLGVPGPVEHLEARVEGVVAHVLAGVHVVDLLVGLHGCNLGALERNLLLR